MTVPSHSVFVARAWNAWESGWSLVVEIVSDGLAQRAADDEDFAKLRAECAKLKRKSAQPSRVNDKGAELEKVREDFRRYYRQVELYCDGLPDAETTEPWDCGCVEVSPTASDRFGNKGWWAVRIYPELNWGADEWRANVLVPMQQHAAEWRRRFDLLKRVAASPADGEQSLEPSATVRSDNSSQEVQGAEEQADTATPDEGTLDHKQPEPPMLTGVPEPPAKHVGFREFDREKVTKRVTDRINELWQQMMTPPRPGYGPKPKPPSGDDAILATQFLQSRYHTARQKMRKFYGSLGQRLPPDKFIEAAKHSEKHPVANPNEHMAHVMISAWTDWFFHRSRDDAKMMLEGILAACKENSEARGTGYELLKGLRTSTLEPDYHAAMRLLREVIEFLNCFHYETPPVDTPKGQFSNDLEVRSVLFTGAVIPNESEESDELVALATSSDMATGESYEALRIEFLNAWVEFGDDEFDLFIAPSERHGFVYMDRGYEIVATVRVDDERRSILARPDGNANGPMNALKRLANRAWALLSDQLRDRCKPVMERAGVEPVKHTPFQLWISLLHCWYWHTDTDYPRADGENLYAFKHSAELITEWRLNQAIPSLPQWFSEVSVESGGKDDAIFDEILAKLGRKWRLVKLLRYMWNQPISPDGLRIASHDELHDKVWDDTVSKDDAVEGATINTTAQRLNDWLLNNGHGDVEITGEGKSVTLRR